MGIIILLIYYVFIVLHENNKSVMDFFEKNIKLCNTLVFSLIIVIGVIEIFLPVKLSYNAMGYVQYMYGTATWFTYISSTIIYLCLFPFIIKNLGGINKNKLFPYFIVLFFFFITLAVSIILPDICIACVALALSCYVMYHTIENPDLRLIEELEKAKDAAMKANQAKTDFLSNMSHELRTPLNVILGFSQSLLEQDLSKSTREDIEDIYSASETLLELVNEILDISKIESEKLEIIEDEYSTKKVFKYLITMTKGKLGNKPLKFIYEMDNKLPEFLCGDSVRIKQIAVNFLTNAVKYTQEGYIKLNMSYEPLDEDNCYLIITVSDSGIGIKEEDLNRLYSKFERFDQRKNANVEGTGLGLALTKKLADLMKAEINAESKYGVGSTFTFKIKQKIIYKEVIDNQEDSIEYVGNFIGNNEKILIVDDNSVNLKVAIRMLKPYKLVIDTASNGAECLEKIAKGNKYDLVFLDDQMPGMNGVETMQHLKEIAGYSTPTIALTANAISGLREKYISQGFNDYLSKPIDKVLLEGILIKFLGNNTNMINNNEKESNVMINLGNDEKIDSNQIVGSSNNEVELLDDTEDKLSLKNPDSEEDNISIGNEKGNVEYLKSQGVDIDKALELLGDMEMYNDMVNDFISEIDNKINDIKKFHDTSDMPNYAIQVHSLKSDSKYLGLMHLAELAYNHEMASKGNDVNYVNEHYDELMKEANKMISVMKKYNG